MALLAQYGTMALAALVALFSVWYAGKTKGEANANNKASEQRAADETKLQVNQIQKAETEAKAEVKAIGKAHDEAVEVSAMSDADVLNELHRDYTRD